MDSHHLNSFNDLFRAILSHMKVVVLFWLYFLYTITYATENYCHDEEANTYWDDLAIYYVDRMDVTNLVKLRNQLCWQVDTGEICVEDATEIFERERE